MDSKARYIELCKGEKSIPLFLKPAWMETVCVDTDWDVALAEDKNGDIVGALPYQVRKKWGLTAFSTPLITPHSGPWIQLDESKEIYQKISVHHKIVEQLIQQLAPANYKYFKLSPTVLPGHPWYWDNYQLNTMYTYWLDISSADNVFNHCKNTIRTEIRNAEKEIKIEEVDSALEFYQLLKNQVGGHYQMLSERQIEKLFALKNKQKLYFKKAIKSGQTIGAALFVKNRNEIFYLIGSRQVAGPNQSLTSLIWHTIKEHAAPNMVFDFEGTMLKSVEPFFRRFGAIPTPYLNVVKMPRWMRLLK